jgi:rubrerythrin
LGYDRILILTLSFSGDISFGVSPIREHQNVNDSMYVNRATPLRHASSGNWGHDVDAAAASVVDAEGRGAGRQRPEDEDAGEGGNGQEQAGGEIDSEGYNKLRNSWNGSSLLQSKSIFENQLSRSKKGSALIISKTKAADSRSVRLVVNLDDSKRGKALTTNERLYWGAKIQRERMEAKINQSAMTQDLEFRVGQESVKVKGKSKQLLKNYRMGGDLQLEVGERLYQDALRQKERREKDSAKAKARVKKEDWSCPLCCTFNEHPPQDADPKICGSCGWKGSIDEATFQPVAVELHYSSKLPSCRQALHSCPQFFCAFSQRVILTVSSSLKIITNDGGLRILEIMIRMACLSTFTRTLSTIKRPWIFCRSAGQKKKMK